MSGLEGEVRARDAGGLADAQTISQARERLAAWLGVEDPVSREVLVAVAVHPQYRRKLVVARGWPDAVRWLLERPPELPPGAATMAGVGGEEIDHSTRALLGRATASIVRWSASGFAVADEETRARRLKACAGCSHLADPPRGGVHRITRLVRSEAKVCDLCGCVVSAKARLLSEECPAVDPQDPTLTLWGEPRGDSAEGRAGSRARPIT